MKRDQKPRRVAKKLLLNVDRVRDLAPGELSDIAGGACLHSQPSGGNGWGGTTKDCTI